MGNLRPVCLDANTGQPVHHFQASSCRRGIRINEDYIYIGEGGELLDRETFARVGGGGRSGCNMPMLAGDYVISNQARIIRVKGGGGVVYSGPCFDHVWCGYGVASNGRVLFVPTTGGTFLLYLVAGEEAESFTTPWLKPPLKINLPKKLTEKDTKLTYPNPFNPECWLPVGEIENKTGKVRVKIYNILGQLVREIDCSNRSSRSNGSKVYWDGKDSRGLEVPSGVYFYEVAGERVRKMIVLR
jgi:hypothetical protein